MRRPAITEGASVCAVSGTTAHSNVVHARWPLLKSGLQDCLTVCATWALISVCAGAAAAYFARQLGAFTYVAFGVYLSVIGALIHGVLLPGISLDVSTRGNGLLAWVGSLTAATLVMAFLALRHPQHDWVVQSFASLWMGFAVPTSAICAAVSTYLVRLAKHKATRLGSSIKPRLTAHRPMSERGRINLPDP